MASISSRWCPELGRVSPRSPDASTLPTSSMISTREKGPSRPAEANRSCRIGSCGISSVSSRDFACLFDRPAGDLFLPRLARSPALPNSGWFFVRGPISRWFRSVSAWFKLIPIGGRIVAAAITPDTAAFLIEPIQGEGDISVPSPGYLSEVAHICRAINVLLLGPIPRYH